MAEEDVTIRLTRDEALVLFEFPTRYSDDAGELQVIDQSEQRVLWDIQASLESTLTEPINNPNDQERIALAQPCGTKPEQSPNSRLQRTPAAHLLDCHHALRGGRRR